MILEDTLEICNIVNMKLLEFIRNQPKGYQADLADLTWQTYSRINTIMSKLRKWERMNAFEAEIMMRGISLLESKQYTVQDFS